MQICEASWSDYCRGNRPEQKTVEDESGKSTNKDKSDICVRLTISRLMSNLLDALYFNNLETVLDRLMKEGSNAADVWSAAKKISGDRCYTGGERAQFKCDYEDHELRCRG